jgi:hypothetical protein
MSAGELLPALSEVRMPSKQSHLATIELNKQNRLAAGLLSERFPSVSRMVINMTYYQKGANPILMLRTINVIPTDSAYFNMDCMIKGCVNGGFDLSRVIAKMVKERKKVGRGRLRCRGKTDVDTSEHASIEYEIDIQYKRKSR